MIEPTEPAGVDDDLASVTSNQDRPDERPSAPRPRGVRRFLRFNLLTALILFLLVSAYFGIRQRYAVSSAEIAAKKTLSELGASLTTKPVDSVLLRDLFLMHGEGFERVVEVAFSEQGTIVPVPQDRPADKRLAALADLPHLTRLFLSGLILEDDDLAHVARCASLETLDATGTSINDAGIERLRTLRELREIRLARTFASDRSLEILAELPELESVFLDDSTTERGIAALARWPKLKHVDATATSLRGEDVRPLAERGIAVTLTPMQGPSPDSDAVVRLPLEEEAFPSPRMSEKELTRVVTGESTVQIQWHGDRRVSKEELAEAIRDPRVVCVALPSCGCPYRFEELRELLVERPAGAPYCRFHGHVLISGEDLLGEAQRSTQTTRYIPYDVSPEILQSLDSVGVGFYDDQAMQLRFLPYLEPASSLPAEPDA